VGDGVARSNGPLPELSDGRVLLRAAAPLDLPAIEDGIHDPDVIRWIGPPEGSAADVLAQNAKGWANGSPTLSICEPDGTFVGKVWVNVRDSDPTTGFVGYWLLPVARGRGIATSAVRLISAWAMGELGLERLRLTTAPDNERSQRVAERSGFRRVSSPAEELVEGPNGRQVVFALDELPRPGE
jgi:RimJ/RimL family protein N-acetyltransferase